MPGAHLTLEKTIPHVPVTAFPSATLQSLHSLAQFLPFISLSDCLWGHHGWQTLCEAFLQTSRICARAAMPPCRDPPGHLPAKPSPSTRARRITASSSKPARLKFQALCHTLSELEMELPEEGASIQCLTGPQSHEEEH